MTGGPQPDRPADRPSWVDILLPAVLASWGTITAGMFVLSVVPRIVALPQAAPIAVFGFLLIYGFFGFVLATVVCTIVGLPALALAGWLKLTKAWQAALIGAIAAFPVMFVFVPRFRSEVEGDMKLLLEYLFILAGALAGIAAWREFKKTDQIRRGMLKAEA